MFGKKKKKNDAQNNELYAQDIIPLKTIEGCFIRRRDNVSLIAVYIEGVNNSLYTYEQKLLESENNRIALSAINRPCSILKIPKTIDSNIQLVHIDKEIARLKKEIREAGNAISDNSPQAIRLALLEQNERPKAEIEALSGNRVIHPTYIVFEFDKKTDDERALREVNIFVQKMNDANRQSHVCSFSELVELLQLYFTPKNINANAIYGNTPVFAKRR